jgi:hypothetical protein
LYFSLQERKEVFLPEEEGVEIIALFGGPW